MPAQKLITEEQKLTGEPLFPEAVPMEQGAKLAGELRDGGAIVVGI